MRKTSSKKPVATDRTSSIANRRVRRTGDGADCLGAFGQRLRLTIEATRSRRFQAVGKFGGGILAAGDGCFRQTFPTCYEGVGQEVCGSLFFLGCLVLGYVSSGCLFFATASSSARGLHSAPLILLSAHAPLSNSAIYFIRRVAGGTGGGSIYEAASSSLTRLGVELAAPFQRFHGLISGLFLSSGGLSCLLVSMWDCERFSGRLKSRYTASAAASKPRSASVQRPVWRRHKSTASSRAKATTIFFFTGALSPASSLSLSLSNLFHPG